MKLYVLRHGKAGAGLPWPEDYHRPLTEEGRAEMRRIAKRLRALDIAPQAIITSPLVRAKETAEIVAQELGLGKVLRVDDRLACGARPGDFQSAVAGLNSAMVVGHEPDLSALVAWLSGATAEMKKGGLAAVECTAVEPNNGTLLWLAPPKLLTG
ncbi:MAG TPA: phosphohistidine phosphatase SixA [Armatimonadota bacterium]|jgi:phosphohistidine phosphatase